MRASAILVLTLYFQLSAARPVVRNIQSAHEFDRLLEKHGTETGLPVVVDFYSDSCGPCRMMAPIFKKVAAEYIDKAVFVKVDTNAQYELSGRFQIRSLPTFQWFIAGKNAQTEVGGIGEQGLRHHTENIIRRSEIENVVVTLEALEEFYQTADPSKTDVKTVFQKCADMAKARQCAGSSANQLARKLRKKYGTVPKTIPRFSADDQKVDSQDDEDKPKSNNSSSKNQTANLHLASLDELQAELEKRQDQIRDEMVEAEDDDEEEADPDFTPWTRKSYPERVVIIGGGPAGLAAALYSARAGLDPLVIAPSLGGGQLQGKGVVVENYPGLTGDATTGPEIVSKMRRQAAHFGALFEDDIVVSVDASQLPFKVTTNTTGIIETHAIIVATGAESNWLNIPGEWELRGAGVSSCATCDGFLYSNQHVVVVGGGDAAMEDALVLARTSKSVTVVHRRDRFRASKVLADRVLSHPSITVRWNTTVQEIVGKELQTEDKHDNDVNLDEISKVVAGVVLKNVESGEVDKISCDALFVAIGHTPTTAFLKDVVDFDPAYPGYLATVPSSTQTSIKGIYAAGDVADPTYRQAITSAGSGAAAALDAERYLSENGLGNEAAELEAELLAELMMDDDAQIDSSYNAYEDAGGRMHGIKESVTGGEF